MREHKLNLLLATLLFGSVACSELDEASRSDSMIAATVNGEPSAWSTRVAANTGSLHGLVLLYASNDAGAGVRLTLPNEPGVYSCAEGIRQPGGFMSVNILYVEEKDAPAAMTAEAGGECTIALESVGSRGTSWEGTFSGVVWRPEAELPDDERRIEITEGSIAVPPSLPIP